MPKISELVELEAVESVDLMVVVDKHTTPSTPETKHAAADVVAGSLLELANGIKSDVTVVSGSAQIRNIISLTQEQYDNIATPDVNTLYVITDAQ